jgi:uncharacterized protein (DUF1697 family)
MALVVLLRGVNVGGYRAFRPSLLAAQLRHFDVVNIGAAGTFVVRAPVGRQRLRAELAKRLPFATEIVISDGCDVVSLTAHDYFAGHVQRPDVVRFVSVLARTPRAAPKTPIVVPPDGEWQLQILAREKQFIVGMHRRNMKAIGYLGKIDRMFGVPATTRSWTTMAAIARVVEDDG